MRAARSVPALKGLSQGLPPSGQAGLSQRTRRKERGACSQCKRASQAIARPESQKTSCTHCGLGSKEAHWGGCVAKLACGHLGTPKALGCRLLCLVRACSLGIACRAGRREGIALGLLLMGSAEELPKTGQVLPTLNSHNLPFL